MWKKSLASALLAASCIAAQPAGAIFVTLDDKGTLFAPYWCDQTKLVNADIDVLPAKYFFKGPCSLTVKFAGVEGHVFMDVPVNVVASYDGAWARETFELGGGTVITSKRRCEKDPFRFGGTSCLSEGSAFSMSSEFLAEPLIKLFPPVTTPIMGGRATPEKIEAAAVGQAESPLTAGSGEQSDLSDWNPFGQEPSEPPTIEVSTPIADAQLPVDTAYEISLAPIGQSRLPVSALLQIERLEEFPKGGDVAPPAGKTHYWQAKWSGMVDSNQLPLHIGRSKSTQGLAQAGLYRVRARAQGVAGDQGGWTPWRAYCLGDSLSCGKIEPVQQIGTDELKATVQSQKHKIMRIPPVRPLPKKAE